MRSPARAKSLQQPAGEQQALPLTVSLSLSLSLGVSLSRSESVGVVGVGACTALTVHTCTYIYYMPPSWQDVGTYVLMKQEVGAPSSFCQSVTACCHLDHVEHTSSSALRAIVFQHSHCVPSPLSPSPHSFPFLHAATSVKNVHALIAYRFVTAEDDCN